MILLHKYNKEHVHLCLSQCADYACMSYAGAGEAHVARVMFAVGLGEAVWCL